MQVTPEEIDALYEVQTIDLETSKLEKQLDELPRGRSFCRPARSARPSTRNSNRSAP